MKHTFIQLWPQKRVSMITGKMERTGNGVMQIRGEEDGICINIELSQSQLDYITHTIKSEFQVVDDK